MRVLTLEGLKQERRKASLAHPIEEPVTFVAPNGEMATVTKRIVNGSVEVYEFSKPLGELLTTPQGLYDLIQKSVIDLELGRENVPLLYTPIYQRREDANFSEYVDIAPFTQSRAVFLEKMELEEVVFGTRVFGQKETVPIITYAAGFQVTEDMIEYDKTWEISEQNRALGEAYNALLNHLHLSPILQYAYAAKNQTAANATEATYREKLRATLKAALIHASQDKNTVTGAPRRPNILLAHSSMRWDIEEVLQRMVIGGTEYPAVSGIDTLIFYDGYSIQVGDRTYTYAGCPTNKAYLIEGGRYFKELVKHDLRTDAGNADISRLIENQVVSRARRGLYASPADAVEEVTLP